MPFFSIIIPALNEEKFLPHLLKNLKSQTLQDFEVIVVDGKSEDKTQAVAHNFATFYPLKIIISDKRNVSYQRNLGAAAAKGRVLIFFDADTQIPKNYLLKIKQAFDTKHAHVLTTWMKPDSKNNSDQLITTATNFLFEASRTFNAPSCYGAMIAIKKGVFDDIGGFDEATAFNEDSQLIIKAVKYHYYYLILKNPRYIYSYRRFRKEGTIDLLYQYLKLNLATLTNGYHGKHPLYSMGGHVFKTLPNTPPSFHWFRRLFRNLKTSKSPKKTVEDFFDRLLPPLD